MVKTHKDLDVYVKSVNFVTEIYKATADFPKYEIYGLTSQVRRAAVSVPSNIAEGSARNHQNEFKQFLYIALASTADIETQLLIAYNLGFLKNELKQKLDQELNTIAKMLQGLIKSLNH
jgi:four helix bundle protein